MAEPLLTAGARAAQGRAPEKQSRAADRRRPGHRRGRSLPTFASQQAKLVISDIQAEKVEKVAAHWREQRR